MYSIIEVKGKLHIQDKDGNFVKAPSGRPAWFGGLIGAKKALKRLNSGKPIKKNNKVRGVMDNRHRNWRRRRG